MSNKVISFNFTREHKNKDPEATYLDLSMRSRQWPGFDARTKTLRYKIENLRDVDSVKNSMHNLFTWIPGQRILDPEFGNMVRKYIYEGNTNITEENVIAEIQSMVDKYEPRVEIDFVGKDPNAIPDEDQKENNELDIVVVYHVKGVPAEKYSVPLLL